MKRMVKKLKSGSATMILGVFILLAFFAFIMMFMEMYNIRENYLVTKNATDTIADGAALYAATNPGSSFSDVRNTAGEIKAVIKDELGVDVGSATISYDDFVDDYTVSISADKEYDYVSNFASASGYTVSTSSATQFSPYYGLGYDLSGIVFVNGSRVGSPTVVQTALSYGIGNGPQKVWDWSGMHDSWCAMFVCWVMANSGEEAASFPGQGQYQCYYMAQCFENVGRLAPPGYNELVPGDIVFFYRNGDPAKWFGGEHQGHVGIIMEVNGSTITTIEGNTNGGVVGKHTYSITDPKIYGFGLMNYTGGITASEDDDKDGTIPDSD